MPLALTNPPAVLSDVLNLDVAEPERVPARMPATLPKNAQVVARRPGREQGLALEHLGHAVEYLIDSRMFLTGIAYTRSEEQALQILMGASRAVFEACPAIVSWRTAVKTWILSRGRAMLPQTGVLHR